MSAKVFRINGYFLLPDDFVGDVNDALRLLLETRLDEGQKNQMTLDDRLGELTVIPAEDEDYETWLVHTFEEGCAQGYRWTGGACVAEWTGGEWKVVSTD